MTTVPISVVIPARDAAGTLADTLDGLERQSLDEAFEVIVVDDGSRDATSRLAQESPVVGRTVRLEGEGPARARNAGAAVAVSDRLAFIDADCRPTAGWLAAGLAALDSADLVLGETRPRPDQPHGPFDQTISVVGCSPLFESVNLFLRRELFERLDGFESWLGPRDGKELGEDVWFGWRARRAGARIAASPEALAHHAVHPRGPVGFIAERSRLRFFPAMARRMPELRQEFFYGRMFLNRRSAALDAALAGMALAIAIRRPALALAVAPYARLLLRDGRADGAGAVAAQVSADLVGLGAMVFGSVRYRSPLL